VEIILDGKRGLISPNPGSTLPNVIAQIDAIVRGLGREVVELKLDGVAIAADDEAAKSRSPGEFGKLEVRTLPQLGVVHALVQKARELLPALATALPKRAEELRRADPKKALEALRPILDVVTVVRSALDLGRDVHLPGDRPDALSARKLEGRIERIDRALVKLEKAIGKEDMDAAGDAIGVALVEALADLDPTVGALGDALPRLPPAPPEQKKP